MPTGVYWRQPFKTLADVTELREFIVMDIEPTGKANGRYLLSEVTVARASDLGRNDITYFTRSHLGNVIHVGDSVLGYHLTGANYNNDEFSAIEASHQYGSRIPDVILVKKHYTRSKKSKRNWRLKRMAKEYEEEATAPVVNVPTTKRQEQEQARMEQDYEMFLRGVEEDSELRHTLDLYKVRQQRAQEHQMDMDEEDEEEEDDPEGGHAVPKINMDDLLEDFDELNMGDTA